MPPKRIAAQRDVIAPTVENAQPKAPVQIEEMRQRYPARTAEVPQASPAQPQPSPTTEAEFRGAITTLTQLVASQVIVRVHKLLILAHRSPQIQLGLETS